MRLLPTLRYLVSQRAKIIVATALTTSGREASRLATQGIAERMAELLGLPVRLLAPSFERDITLLSEGEIAMAPDLSGFTEERAHDERWAFTLASAIDVYVLDGLIAARDGGASVVELPRLLCACGVGDAVDKAFDMVHDATMAPAPEPFTLVLGGPSVRRVEPLFRAVLPSCKDVLLGGAVANTFLAAQGFRPGGSAHEPNDVALALELLNLAHANGVVVHMPADALVRTSNAGATTYDNVALDRAMLASEAVVDLGAETCVAYVDVLARSATVLWVGLLGDGSVPETQQGSMHIAQVAARAPRALAAGEDTVHALRDFRLEPQFKTAAGGEAVIALLAGENFPGLQALQR
jgi:phosphoglycerate kinase